MKRNWIVEIVLFSILLTSTLFAIHFFVEEKKLEKQTTTLSGLLHLIPTHSNEIISTNFTSVQNYDLYAQLQLKIDSLSKQLDSDSNLYQDLDIYSQTASHYMQLITMLLTSKKIISQSEFIENKSKEGAIDSLILNLLKLTSEFKMQHIKPMHVLMSQLEGSVHRGGLC